MVSSVLQQVEGNGPSPLLSAGEATAEVLGPVLASPVHKRHGHTEDKSVKDD